MCVQICMIQYVYLIWVARKDTMCRLVPQALGFGHCACSTCSVTHMAEVLQNERCAPRVLWVRNIATSPVYQPHIAFLTTNILPPIHTPFIMCVYVFMYI